MNRFLIFMTALLPSLAFAGGTIIAGGTRPIIHGPDVPFSYSCQITVSYQQDKQTPDGTSKTCYAEAQMSSVFSSQDLEKDGPPSIYKETSATDPWMAGNSWEGCAVPAAILNGQRMELLFARNSKNQSTLTLAVTAVAESNGNEITSDGSTDAPFDQRKIQAKTHFSFSNTKSNEDLIVNLEVTCQRSL